MNLSPNELQRRLSSEGRNSNSSSNPGQNLSFGLASQWLEQQQQQLGTIDPALLLLDSVPPQQRMLLQRQQQQHQQQQQQLGGSASLPNNEFDLQRAYLQMDLQRRNQPQAPQDRPLSQQQQEALLLMMDESRAAASRNSGSANLQQDLARLLAATTPGSNTGTPMLPERSVARPGTMDTALIDRLLAAELSQGENRNRQSKMEEAARMLQLHEVLQQQGEARRRDSTAPGPVMRFQTTNSAPQDPHILPAMFNTGSVGMLPLTRTQPSVLFDNQFRAFDKTKGVEKRKSDDRNDPTLDMGTAKKRATSFVLPAMPAAENSSFPLPSKKRARKVTFSLTSYRDLWNELEESEMQEEAFRRRIFEGIKLRGTSRSVRKP